jgi:predicted ATP-grasp superfamily ATP-dependent carboligase
VVGSDYRGLAAVRSLGRRGVPVWVLSGGDDILATKSRYAQKSLALEGSDDDERVEFLLRVGRDHRLDGWALFPTTDESAAMIGRAHARVQEQYALTSPPWEVLRWAYDKRLTYRLADTLGIAYPRTWQAASAHEAKALDIDYPVIIKPAVKEQVNPLTTAKAWRADDADELEARFAAAAQLMDPSLLVVQELVPGDGDGQLSYAALCDRGRPLARVVARRTRQYPADFGRASTFVETIPEQAEVVEPSERLLAEIGFDGLVEVEFKRDPRDGSLKLLDINPRVWGWHGLCQRAGVDFPFLAWSLATHQGVPETRYDPGVRWVRLSTDLPVSLREIVAGRLSPRRYLRTIFSAHESAVFGRDDPWPAVVELPMLAGTLVRRLRSGVAV